MPKERVLPHDLDAERATLGAVLVQPTTWPIVVSVLREQDFYREGHRRIFKALASLADAGVPPDLIPLADKLRTAGDMDEAGGMSYLASLVDGLPASTNAEHYAAIVREKAGLRAAIHTADTLMTKAYAAQDRAVAIADDAINELTASVSVAAGSMENAETLIDNYVREIQAGTAGHAIGTGFIDLDALIGGFKPGDLAIVAGRPSTGKTAWALVVSDHIAAVAGPSIFFSMEMDKQSCAARLLAARSGVATQSLERGTASDRDYERVNDSLQMQPVPLLIEDRSRTLTEMGAWCRRAKAANDGVLVCAFVDYLQLMVAERKRDSDEAEIAAISKGLKRLARDLNISVIALSQLSRAPEARRDKRPQMSDLRGSGAIEQDCDVGLLLFRPEMYAPKPENAGIAEVIVAKHRNGPTGVVRLQFQKELALFRNLTAAGMF